MQRASLVTTEISHPSARLSALVLDKTGLIGEALVKKLSEELLVVYVSKNTGVGSNFSKNIIHVSYNTKFPVIPDNNYCYTFIVDDTTKITRELLPKFIDKVDKDNSQLIFLTHILEINQKPILDIINNKAAKIIIYGDIFDKNRPNDFKASQFVVNKFIWEARKFGKIEIMGNGLKKTYPVFLDTAIDAILEVVFGSSGVFSIFYLYPKHPPTEISLAHMIQKANPNLHIDFIREKRRERKSATLPQNGKYLLEHNYKLNEIIKKIFLEDSTKPLTEETNKDFETRKNNYNLLPFFGLLYLIFLMLLPLITTLSFSFLGFRALNSVKEEVNRGRLINAQKLIDASSNYFYLARKISAPLLLEAKVIGMPSGLESIIRNIRLGEDVSSMGLYFIESLNKYSMVFMNQSKNPKADFIQAGSLLKNSMVLLQKIQGEEKLPASFNLEIKDFDPLIKFAEGGVDILPNIFGFEGVKTYLIIFQNNLELRPGGGFIGSYALLTVNEGIVKDFSIHDVYDADRQLKGHVEPPYPIRRFLKEKHWYLRDSNFDIDFVKSASRSAFFLSLETDRQADGVFAIDVSFIKNLISVVNPIYLAEYKQLVDQNNLFNLTEKYIEKDFEGSKQRRDFLGSLYEATLLDISQKKNLQYLSLAKVVSDSLTQKHLLFAFASPDIQDFFTVNNWSSAIWDKRLKTEDTINDFVGINEANLGSRVNYFVKRKVSQNITMDNKGEILGELSVLYDNVGSSSHQEGDYKNYLRIILQPDAELLSISIDGNQQSVIEAITNPKVYEAKNFVLPQGLEVDKTQEKGKTVYGFLTNIKAGKKQTITVKYSLYKKAPLNKPLVSYNLRFFKQPGTDEYPFDFSLSYPASMNVVSVPSHMTKKENKVFFSRNITSDEIISISLAGK